MSPHPEDGVTSKDAPADDELSRAMGEVWLQGVPEVERRLAARLSTEMRGVVAARLRAVAGWTGEIDRKPSSLMDAIAAAGTSRSRFFALLAEWRRSRSIAGMGARAAEKRTREARLDPVVRKAAVRLIGDAIREDPEVGIASLGTILDLAGLPPMSRTMIGRLRGEARRAAPPGALGGELVFDSVGLDAVTDGERMRLFVALDRGTGLVLGWAQATNRSRAWGHVHAAGNAIEHLPSTDLTGFTVAGAGPSVVLTMQKDDLPGGGVLQRRLSEAGIPYMVAAAVPGSVAVNALGERLGSFWLGVGERDDGISYRNGRPARMPEYTAEMVVELEAAIEAHNAGRRAAGSRFVDAGGEPVTGVRKALLRALIPIEGAAVELGMLPSYSEAATLAAFERIS